MINYRTICSNALSQRKLANAGNLLSPCSGGRKLLRNVVDLPWAVPRPFEVDLLTLFAGIEAFEMYLHHRVRRLRARIIGVEFRQAVPDNRVDRRHQRALVLNGR